MFELGGAIGVADGFEAGFDFEVERFFHGL